MKNDAVVVVVAAVIVVVAAAVVFALVVVVAIEIATAELLLFSCKEHPYFGATVFFIRNGNSR